MRKSYYFTGIIAVFCLFTGLLMAGKLAQGEYVALVLALLILLLAGVFTERVESVVLWKFAIRLYKQNEESLEWNAVAMQMAEILIKLDEQSTGTARRRKEREALIDNLLATLKADETKRKEMLADAQLITRLMETEEGPELDKIRADIEKKGLMD